MAKKLTVEVDADVSKAKRKVKDLGGSIESPASSSAISPAAKRAADALDGAAKGGKALSDAAREGSASMKTMSKVFGGMAIRMATSYAANMMEKGSTAQTVAKGVGTVASGAIAGSAAGVGGAVAGAAIGLVETVVDVCSDAKSKAESIAKYSEEFSRSEQNYASDRKWKNKIDSLTKVEDGFTDFAGRISSINAELERYREAEQIIVNRVKELVKSGDLDAAGQQRDYLARNRARQAQLENAAKTMESLQTKKQETPFRASDSAVDALSRIGGGSFGGDYAKKQLEAAQQTVTVLKSIDSKTKGTGASWQ